MSDLRIGDIVSVTARVKSLRGDGGVWLEPIGFDYTLEGYDEWDMSKHEYVLKDLGFYTVDDATLIRRGLVRGDEKFAGDGERWIYHEDLGNGLHLMNRADVKQCLPGAWAVMDIGAINLMFDEAPIGASTS